MLSYVKSHPVYMVHHGSVTACKRYLGFFQARFVLVILSFWMRVTNSQGWTTFGAVQEVLPGLKVRKFRAWEMCEGFPPKKSWAKFWVQP